MDMDEPQSNCATTGQPTGEHAPQPIERFIRVTYDKLPAETKVLVALFSALNTASTLTKGFELPDDLWGIVRFGNGGPLIGESEEVNWLKGLADGILLVANYS
jgi:hypothetical protein